MQPPKQMSLHTIGALCRRETQRFLLQLGNDPAFCYELFRRGLVHPPHEDREGAWRAVYVQYHLQLVRAAQKHPLIGVVGISAETAADLAFTKMWQSFHNKPDKFAAFERLAPLIKYLQTCVHSVLVDAARRQKQEAHTQPYETIGTAQPFAEAIDRVVLWREIGKRVRDEQEATVVYAAFELGLPARKVFEAFPGRFESVREIHRITERILRRLRRDADLKVFLEAFR